MFLRRFQPDVYPQKEYISKFEELFSDYLGGGNGCYQVEQLLLNGLKSLGIGKGDEAIVPDFTAASINAIINCGANLQL